MGKKRGKNPICEPWETNGGGFVRLYRSMIDSEAFNDLSFRQQMLLIRFKEKHILKVANGEIAESNNGILHFTAQEQRKFYRYDDGKQFRQDRDALISHGFLRFTFRGANLRLPNTYELIGDWKNWRKRTDG